MKELIVLQLETRNILIQQAAREFPAMTGIRVCPNKNTLFVFRMIKVDKDISVHKMDVVERIDQVFLINRVSAFESMDQILMLE